MKDVTEIIIQGRDFIKSEFNLELSKSTLKHYSKSDWKTFCQVNNFDSTQYGLYVPKSYTAYVHNDPFFISNIFHEFFGHGLFCEHAILGQELVKNEINNNSKEFPYSKTKKYLSFTDNNILDYEGFALWMEYTLCKETNNEKIWNDKKQTFSKDIITLIEYFQSCEEKFTRYGFMAQMSFPRYNNPDKIIAVVKKLYDLKFKNIETIIFYGSKKPYSDIDLFIISNNPSRNYFNGWLDIYELNIKDFEYLKNNLDISVTDPIFTGTQIYGQLKLDEYKRDILNQKITQKMISHSKIRAMDQKEAINETTDDRLVKIATGYSNTYEFNAKELALGNKILTFKELENKYGYMRPL